MMKLIAILSILATAFFTSICIADDPIYCPQTIEAYCNSFAPTGAATCSVTSQPSDNFDMLFENPEHYTGSVAFTFHYAETKGGYALCVYSNSHQVVANVTNKDIGPEMTDDTDLPGNHWHDGEVSRCGSTIFPVLAQACPFKFR